MKLFKRIYDFLIGRLKVAVTLAVLMAAGTAYAEMPDVSKWSCSKGTVQNDRDYDMEITNCDCGGSRKFYVKVSGELIYIHYEHRTDVDKTVYYNALKINDGNWVEIINKKYLVLTVVKIRKSRISVAITDNNNVVIAERTIPLFKKGLN